jgi:hypothetical protein
VQTTLVAYDAIGGPGRSRLIQDRGSEYLRADTRAVWRRAAQAGAAPLGYRYTDFMKRVAGTLHEALARTGGRYGALESVSMVLSTVGSLS